MYRGSGSSRAHSPGSQDEHSVTTPLLLDSMDEESKSQHDLQASYSESTGLDAENTSNHYKAKSAPWWSYFWVSLERSNACLSTMGELIRASGL